MPGPRVHCVPRADVIKTLFSVTVLGQFVTRQPTEFGGRIGVVTECNPVGEFNKVILRTDDVSEDPLERLELAELRVRVLPEQITFVKYGRIYRRPVNGVKKFSPRDPELTVGLTVFGHPPG